MRSITAIIAGFLYITLLGLVIQLAFMFLSIGYSELSRDYAWLKTFGSYTGYVVGIIVYFMLMASGGFITASIARSHIILHCLVIGASTTLLSLLSSRNTDEITLLGALFVISGIIFTIIGGTYWKKTHQATAGTGSVE